MSLRVLGDPRALALAGPPEAAADGVADPAAGGAPEGATLHLGATDGPADIVWLPHTGEGLTPAGGRFASGESAVPSPGAAIPLVIATAGAGLWSRAPWPAADALFELPPPSAPHALVVAADAQRREQVVDKLAARGHSVAGAEELTVEDLAGAGVVALLGDAGAATDEAPWTAAAMPAEAPAVLAARRVLIAPRCATTFGLLAGTDHLAFATADDVVQYADAALTFPESFEPFRALGALAAEPHRASRVYARLAAELRSARRSSAPGG